MIIISNAITRGESGDFVPSIRLSGCGMEKFCVFSAKFNPPYGASILPVDTLVM
jgi:hypothetical protein